MFVIYSVLLCCSMGVYGQQPQGKHETICGSYLAKSVVHEVSLAIKGKCSCYENNRNGLSNRYCVKQDGQITVNMAWQHDKLSITVLH